MKLKMHPIYNNHQIQFIYMNSRDAECSVAKGAVDSSICLKIMQNRTILVVLRPRLAQKMKTASPKGIWVPKLRRSCRDSAGRTVRIFDSRSREGVAVKNHLNF